MSLTVPRGWGYLPLRRLAICRDDLREPVNATERDKMAGDIPYWGANAIQGFVNRAKVSRSVVLLGEDGAPFFDRNKPVAFYVDEPIWPNNHIHVLFPNDGTNGRWLAYALNTVDYSTVITGATRDKLTQGAMKSIMLLVPPSHDQSAIADYLDHETAQIDALVAKQEELIARLDERRLAVVTTTALDGFQGEARGDHAVARWGSSLAVEPWLAAAPASWVLERFKTVCRPREERNSMGSEMMLSLTVKGYLTDRSTMTIQQNAAETSIPRYLVARPGDLVVNPMWLIGGAIGVSDKRGAVSPDYRVFEISDRLDPWYLHAVLRSAPYFDQYKLYTRSNTTFDRRIKQNDLDNLPLPIPPLDEQRAIVEHIQQQTTQIDALIAKAEEHIALAKERRSALITAAVTGQMDVRTARRAS